MIWKSNNELLRTNKSRRDLGLLLPGKLRRVSCPCGVCGVCGAWEPEYQIRVRCRATACVMR
jgi:hypothetical protein